MKDDHWNTRVRQTNTPTQHQRGKLAVSPVTSLLLSNLNNGALRQTWALGEK